MVRMFALERCDSPWLDCHTSALRCRLESFGHIRISIGVYHDISSQSRHHTSHMQHFLRVRDCSSG